MSKTYNKNNEKIDAKIGEVFTIELESNPTTGYQWQENFDESKVKLLKKDINLASKKIGGSATEVFTFQSLAIGQTKICFEYKRVWENEGIESIEISLNSEKNI
jgi:inhibitor of cysteine peptidase